MHSKTGLQRLEHPLLRPRVLLRRVQPLRRPWQVVGHPAEVPRAESGGPVGDARGSHTKARVSVIRLFLFDFKIRLFLISKMFLKFYFFPGCVSSYFKFCLFFLFCGLFRFFCFLALAFISFDNKLLNIYYRILLIPAIMRCNVSPTDRETEVSEQINKCRNETSAARKKKCRLQSNLGFSCLVVSQSVSLQGAQSCNFFCENSLNISSFFCFGAHIECSRATSHSFRGMFFLLRLFSTLTGGTSSSTPSSPSATGTWATSPPCSGRKW